MKRKSISDESLKKIAQSVEDSDLMRYLKEEVEEAYAHLGAAIAQSIPEDDQIIMDHVRSARDILGRIWQDLR